MGGKRTLCEATHVPTLCSSGSLEESPNRDEHSQQSPKSCYRALRDIMLVLQQILSIAATEKLTDSHPRGPVDNAAVKEQETKHKAQQNALGVHAFIPLSYSPACRGRVRIALKHISNVSAPLASAMGRKQKLDDRVLCGQEGTHCRH